MKKDDYYKKLHNKNMPTFKELVKRIYQGCFKIASITIDDRADFGHRRVVIFLHEKEE